MAPNTAPGTVPRGMASRIARHKVGSTGLGTCFASSVVHGGIRGRILGTLVGNTLDRNRSMGYRAPDDTARRGVVLLGTTLGRLGCTWMHTHPRLLPRWVGTSCLPVWVSWVGKSTTVVRQMAPCYCRRVVRAGCPHAQKGSWIWAGRSLAPARSYRTLPAGPTRSRGAWAARGSVHA